LISSGGTRTRTSTVALRRMPLSVKHAAQRNPSNHSRISSVMPLGFGPAILVRFGQRRPSPVSGLLAIHIPTTTLSLELDFPSGCQIPGQIAKLRGWCALMALTAGEGRQRPNRKALVRGRVEKVINGFEDYLASSTGNEHTEGRRVLVEVIQASFIR